VTHTVIHRHHFSPAEVADALGLLGPGENTMLLTVTLAGWLQVDLINPGEARPESPPAAAPALEPSIETLAAPLQVGSQVTPKIEEPAIGASDSDSPPWDEDEASPPGPDLKGGALAQRASICCGEGSFRLLLGVETAEEARAEILRRCGITTRKMLDHDPRAAEIWRVIDGKYRLWLDGHDVELD